MNSIVKPSVDEDLALQILGKHKTIKKEEYSIISKTKDYIPYYVFNITISIKRGFNLNPRIIEYIYWVNAIDGKLVRSADIPELDEFKDKSIQQEKLDMEECKQLAKKSAFKLATRFYKSFWTPEIKVEFRGKYYISFWNIGVHLTNKNIRHDFAINSFSGEVSKEVR